MLHFFIILSQFPFLLGKLQEVLKMRDSFLDSLSIWFHWENLPSYDLGLFDHIFHMSDVICSHPVVSLSLTFDEFQGCRDVQFYTLEAISNILFLKYHPFVICQNVGVCLCFFSTSSNRYR